MPRTVNWPDLKIDTASRLKGEPGVSIITFPSGVEMVLSSFDILKGVEITFPDLPQECRVSAIFFISGNMEIRLGNGYVGEWVPRTSCLLRSDTTGFSLFARESGWVSHVCISMSCNNLAKRFPGETPHILRDALFRPRPVDTIRPLLNTQTMGAAALALLEPGPRDAFEQARCEPLALQFLLEALSALQLNTSVVEERLAHALEQAQALHAAVLRDPTVELNSVLGLHTNLSQQRAVLRVFKDQFGLSLRKHRHKTVMERARAALSDGALIKQLAYDLGYTHVANFTRAYRRAFGESPSQTLRRRVLSQRCEEVLEG